MSPVKSYSPLAPMSYVAIFSVLAFAAVSMGQGRPSEKRTKESSRLQLYKQLGQQGRVDIQYSLGELYDPDRPSSRVNEKSSEKGQPFRFIVTKSYAEAVKWYYLAANSQGHLEGYELKGREAAIGRLEELNAASTNPEIAAALRPENTADLKPDLEQLKYAAMDDRNVFYPTRTLRAAENWSQAADKWGTSAEKTTAHKWFAAHKQAQSFDVKCQACASPPTQTEASAAKSDFYKSQGKEFSAFAKYWNKRSVRQEEEETGEHVSTKAEIVAGAIADSVDTVAQGHAKITETNQRAAELRTKQIEMQRRANEEAAAVARLRFEEQVKQQQQAADQRLAQQRTADSVQQKQETADRLQESQQPVKAQAQYLQSSCLQFSYKQSSVVVMNSCGQPVDARWCWQRKNGTWDCYLKENFFSGESNSQFLPDTNNQKVWVRVPGSSSAWPKP